MKRRYFYLAEKESKDVSGSWRALHATLLILTAISSAVGLNSFNDIYDIFNYRCVPYAKLRFLAQEVVFFNVSKEDVATTETTPGGVGNATGNDTQTLPAAAKPQQFRPLDEDEPVEIDFKMPKGTPRVMRARNKGVEPMIKIPNTPDTYVFEDEIWLMNDTMMAKVSMDMMKTVFATVLTCDYVLLAAMFSIVVSTSFAVITLMCSAGGLGQQGTGGVTQPYRYVYVLLACSVVMVINCGVANNIVNRGFHQFCYRCAKFTGSQTCTHVMDYFTPQQKLGLRPFYRDWAITTYAHLISIWLWIVQLLLTILRVITKADFEFRTIFLRRKVAKKLVEEDEDDDEDGRLRRALRQKIPDVSRGEIELDEKDLVGPSGPEGATQV